MGFVTLLLKVISMLPTIVSGVEAVYSGLKGNEKQKTVIDFVGTSLNIAEAISAKDIVDNNAFQEGLKQANDGIVKMLNASIWYKKK